MKESIYLPQTLNYNCSKGLLYYIIVINVEYNFNDFLKIHFYTTYNDIYNNIHHYVFILYGKKLFICFYTTKESTMKVVY